MYRGYTRLWRKLEDSTILSYGLKPMGILCLLMVKCNHKTKKWQGETVEPGQIITSINNLSIMCYESPKTIRRLLKILEGVKIIEVSVRANRWHKITLCNWETYQNSEAIEGKLKEQDRGKERERKGNEKGTRLKNVKNEKNEKKVKQTPEAFLKELSSNPIYAHIDIKKELGKMDVWILANPGRKKTQKFVVGWLNRIDVPMKAENRSKYNVR